MTESVSTRSELEDLLEHLERYRAVTLLALDLVSDDQLAWRPRPEMYSLGQQFVHVAQAEDMHAHGLFENDWNPERTRLPKVVASRTEVRALFERVRTYTLEHASRLDDSRLGTIPPGPDFGVPWSLRSGLWFILEHELHHRGQIWLYLRLLDITPPFYAMPLPQGARPDIQARQDLGGF